MLINHLDFFEYTYIGQRVSIILKIKLTKPILERTELHVKATKLGISVMNDKYNFCNDVTPICPLEASEEIKEIKFGFGIRNLQIKANVHVTVSLKSPNGTEILCLQNSRFALYE